MVTFKGNFSCKDTQEQHSAKHGGWCWSREKLEVGLKLNFSGASFFIPLHLFKSLQIPLFKVWSLGERLCWLVPTLTSAWWARRSPELTLSIPLCICVFVFVYLCICIWVFVGEREVHHREQHPHRLHHRQPPDPSCQPRHQHLGHLHHQQNWDKSD